jgi:HEAT repeat protein
VSRSRASWRASRSRAPAGIRCRATSSSALSPKGAEIALAAIAALGEISSPAAEAPLVAALTSAVPGVTAAAARSLGQAGTARAVPALRDAEERGGDIRRAARETVALIQSRLTGATPGQVSLAGGEAGQVSVVETADGRVSLDS